jgi:hypothetical protein
MMLAAPGFVLLTALALLTAGPASAQFGGSGALGGPFASRGLSRPLGGVGPRNPNLPQPRLPGGVRAGAGAIGVYAFPYAYSTYVPNYFSNSDYDYWGVGQPPALYGNGLPAPVPAGQQPVIINQYFGTPPPDYSAQQQNSQGSLNTFQAPSAPVPGQGQSSAQSQTNNSANAPGDPLGPVENYYLIAYKDHSVYTVLAYWVEGDTLHYVTTQNTHNQASMALIDLDLSRTLNQARGVPFTIAGR